MRTIKFRGYDAVGNKGWVYGDLVHNQKVTPTGLEPRVMVGGYEVFIETIGQFTGLLDKDGKEIYEGDIVEMPRKPEHSTKKVLTRHIVTSDSVMDWTWKSLTKEVLDLSMGNNIGNWELLHRHECEVIGNIYDNPNLSQQTALNLPERKPRNRRSREFEVEYVVTENPSIAPRIAKTSQNCTKVIFEITQEDMDNLCQTVHNKFNKR